MGLRAVQWEADQRVGAVTVERGLVTSRTRPREAEASPARKAGPRACQGSRGLETRDGKVNRVPVDRGTDMVTDGLDELGVDDEDIQGPSQQELALMLRDMEM